MFVTSDILDHSAIGRFRGFEWRENLLGGIDVHGTEWPGYQPAAQFMLEAAKRCRVIADIRWAGYNVPTEKRTRNILPKSFERLAQGELAGGRAADSVLFRGERSAEGTENGDIDFGGRAGSIRYRRGPAGAIALPGPPWRFEANFIFPLDEDPIALANDLFQMAVDLLGVEYGYHFIRDQLGGPRFYTHGIIQCMDYNPRYDGDGTEIGEWADVVSDGRLWSGPFPRFRDLFQVNLISERHTSVPIGGLGYLAEWIGAHPGRGRLEDIGRGRWLWTLTDAEMFDVRPLLNAAGLLVSCLPRVYRDLPGGGQDA